MRLGCVVHRWRWTCRDCLWQLRGLAWPGCVVEVDEGTVVIDGIAWGSSAGVVALTWGDAAGGAVGGLFAMALTVFTNYWMRKEDSSRKKRE